MKEFDKEMNRGLVVYVLSVVVVFTVALVVTLLHAVNDTPESCTCRFQQHRVHYGNTYTKTNRKCIDLGNGSVQAGDTVYLDVKWYRNECE